MKNTLLIIAIILFAIPCEAQKSAFSEKAIKVMHTNPEMYTIIVQHSAQKYSNNENMIDEVNEQIASIYALLDIIKKIDKLVPKNYVLSDALIENSYEGYEEKNKRILGDPLDDSSVLELHVDWNDVLLSAKIKLIILEYREHSKTKGMNIELP